jgi:hypothetical protein
MSRTMKQFLFWTPRILCILFAAFISIFALDVFGQGYSFWQTVVALLMHLMPTWIILITLAVAWRWEWVGGILFAALGIFYIISMWGRFPWSVYLVIAVPAFLLATLFMVNWFYRGQIRTRNEQESKKSRLGPMSDPN